MVADCLGAESRFSGDSEIQKVAFLRRAKVKRVVKVVSRGCPSGKPHDAGQEVEGSHRRWGLAKVASTRGACSLPY